MKTTINHQYPLKKALHKQFETIQNHTSTFKRPQKHILHTLFKASLKISIQTKRNYARVQKKLTTQKKKNPKNTLKKQTTTTPKSNKSSSNNPPNKTTPQNILSKNNNPKTKILLCKIQEGCLGFGKVCKRQLRVRPLPRPRGAAEMLRSKR